MRVKIFALAALLFLINCANYKQLKPEPMLSSKEGRFIELKRGKKDFELAKNKKFFIAFPNPGHDNFYLVLKVLC